MNLNIESLKDIQAWEKSGISIPSYDIENIVANTKNSPKWVHFGAGNIFRMFIGGIADKLISEGEMDSGISCVETFDFDVIDKIYKPNDNLAIGVTLNVDGSIDKQVIGSLSEALKAQYTDKEHWERIKKIFVNPELELASFTITEKGYALKNSSGAYFPFIQADINNGPEKSVSAMAVFTAMLWERFKNGAAPLAVVSMDNCSHNGAKLKSAVIEFATQWFLKGYVSEEFLGYITDEKKVAFPWTMIDKITPRPSDSVKQQLEKDGLENMDIIVTSKNTYIAPFVNAEKPQYLVIEDKFPNGRPQFERAGVYMTDRATVNKIETMKVTTCLNPLHTALAVYGCVLGYTLIADEMKDDQLVTLVNKIGLSEGMPVVVDPGILSPESFVNEVLNIRIPNPFMPDSPQRIATDTSQKVGIRYGVTIKSYMEKFNDAKKLVYIPLAIAGWCRYLLGVDDEGNEFELSSDPMKDELCEKLKDIKVGDVSTYTGQLKGILSNVNIFGVDLYKAGIGELVEDMFVQEIKGQGAVRETLKKYC